MSWVGGLSSGPPRQRSRRPASPPPGAAGAAPAAAGAAQAAGSSLPGRLGPAGPGELLGSLWQRAAGWRSGAQRGRAEEAIGAGANRGRPASPGAGSRDAAAAAAASAAAPAEASGQGPRAIDAAAGAAEAAAATAADPAWAAHLSHLRAIYSRLHDPSAPPPAGLYGPAGAVGEPPAPGGFEGEGCPTVSPPTSPGAPRSPRAGAGAGPGLAAAPAPPVRLSLCTWNVQLLSVGAGSAAELRLRAARAGAALGACGFDVVCLQEVWDPAARAVLAASLGARYAYVASPAPLGPSGSVRGANGSGLLIACGLLQRPRRASEFESADDHPSLEDSEYDHEPTGSESRVESGHGRRGRCGRAAVRLLGALAFERFPARGPEDFVFDKGALAVALQVRAPAPPGPAPPGLPDDDGDRSDAAADAADRDAAAPASVASLFESAPGDRALVVVSTHLQSDFFFDGRAARAAQLPALAAFAAAAAREARARLWARPVHAPPAEEPVQDPIAALDAREEPSAAAEHARPAAGDKPLPPSGPAAAAPFGPAAAAPFGPAAVRCVPVIIAGDLNVKAGSVEAAAALRALGDPVDCCAAAAAAAAASTAEEGGLGLHAGGPGAAAGAALPGRDRGPLRPPPGWDLTFPSGRWQPAWWRRWGAALSDAGGRWRRTLTGQLGDAAAVQLRVGATAGAGGSGSGSGGGSHQSADSEVGAGTAAEQPELKGSPDSEGAAAAELSAGGGSYRPVAPRDRLDYVLLSCPNDDSEHEGREGERSCSAGAGAGAGGPAWGVACELVGPARLLNSGPMLADHHPLVARLCLYG